MGRQIGEEQMSFVQLLILKNRIKHMELVSYLYLI